MPQLRYVSPMDMYRAKGIRIDLYHRIMEQNVSLLILSNTTPQLLTMMIVSYLRYWEIMMRFELARMFLTERKQADLFSSSERSGQLSREQWLREIFGKVIDFEHRNAPRRYDPDPVREDKSNRIIARLGREMISQENDVNDHLKEITRPYWRACLVIIDPQHHADGQKIAIEASSSVGSGFGNFKSLVAAINGRSPPEPYAIELHSITDSTTFWEYVDANAGKVTSITLEIAVPNMFGGESSFEEDAKRLRDREKARKIRETIENPDGLEPNTDRMKAAVSYATRGGGKVKAKAVDAPPYDSTKDKKYMDVDVDNTKKDFTEKTEAALSAFDEDESGEVYVSASEQLENPR